MSSNNDLRMAKKTIIPLNVDSKYLGFLYNNFSGSTAEYYNKKVKAIDLSVNSPLGKFLRINCKKSNTPLYKLEFNLFIALQSQQPKATIYQSEDGRYSALYLPRELVSDFNRLIHKLFKNALVSYVNGYADAQMDEASFFKNDNEGSSRRKVRKKAIKKAIHNFIRRNEMENYSSSPAVAIERMYFREVKKPMLNNFAKV